MTSKTLGSGLLFAALMASASPRLAKAQETGAGSPAPESSPVAVPGVTSGSTPKLTQDEVENNRLKTLQGSKSPWSFQLQLTYSGSSINHPFAEDLPNPGNSSVIPLVQLSGTVSGRYRFDPETTVGVGTGITTLHPFQGPSLPGTTVANPYADIAHSYAIDKIHNFADFSINGYTDQQNHTAYGAIIGLTATNESQYTFPFGLTAGFFIELDFNFFEGKEGYPLDGQTVYDLYTDPYFEYILSKTFNLRTVIGIEALGHQNDMRSAFAQYHQKIYQTLGVGISATHWLFLYPYVKANDYTDMSVSTVTFGFSTIINIL